MSLGAPPGPATAPGSPPHGSGHWWAKRLTSIALLPLTIWFVPSMAMLAGKSHGAVVAWLGAPLNAQSLHGNTRLSFFGECTMNLGIICPLNRFNNPVRNPGYALCCGFRL